MHVVPDPVIALEHSVEVLDDISVRNHPAHDRLHLLQAGIDIKVATEIVEDDSWLVMPVRVCMCVI